MPDTYRAVLIGHEIGDRDYIVRPYSHAASCRTCERTELVALTGSTVRLDRDRAPRQPRFQP